ncbi:MAG TPA: histidine kinase [Croceibacterium sp.]
MRPLARDGLNALGVAVGYVACAFVCAAFSVSADGFAIISPVRPFLIAVLLLLPTRRWWCVAAVIPTHILLAAAVLQGAPPGLVATQVLGHLAVALGTAFAVRKVNSEESPFEGVAAVLKFILLAGIAVPAVVDGAILGVHAAAGWTEGLWHSWEQWMIAGFFPTITIPPLLFLATRGGFSGWPRASRALQSEIALVAPLLLVVSLLAFGGVVDAAEWPAVYFMPLPLLLWATARFGVGGTSLALLAMAAGIAVQALRQMGPFAAPSLVEEVASLHAFLAAISAPLLLFAALMDERRRTATLLRQFDTGIQVAASQTDTGLWLWDAVAPRLFLTANCRTMFGLPDEDTNTPFDFLDAVHPDDKAVVGEALSKTLAGGKRMPVLEFRLCSGGKTRWFVLQTRSVCDEAGRLLSVSGVFRDISERIESRLAVERLEERLASLQDDERRRIAEELHDSTAQHLVAAKFGLLSLRKQASDDTKEVIEDIYRSLREATTEIRTFTYLLHASQVDEEGISALLGRYVPGFERRTGIRTVLRATGRADELSGELQHALLRITQESLGNVHRHAGATRATVDLRWIGNAVHLVVCDNGKGMNREEGEQLGERLRLGLGVRNISVRVRATRCRNCGDCNGGGAAIHVALPVLTPAPANARGIANRAREALGAGRG